MTNVSKLDQVIYMLKESWKKRR